MAAPQVRDLGALRSRLQDVTVALRRPRFGVRVAIQNVAYNILVEALRPPSLDVLISKRLLVHFPELVDDVAIVDRDHAFALLRGLPRHAAMCILKSWLNGWCASRRFHEVRTLSCLLGCLAPDTFAHYAACPRLWNVVAARTHGQRSASTIERLGLVPGARRREALANLALSLHLVPRAEDRELADVRGRDPRALLRCSCPSLEGRGIRTRAQAGLQVAMCSYIVRKVHVHMCIFNGVAIEANLWIYMELHRCLLSRCWITPLYGF